MAIIYRCDMCKNESTNSDFLSQINMPGIEWERSHSKDHKFGIDYGLCGNCIIKIREFILGEQKKDKL